MVLSSKARPSGQPRGCDDRTGPPTGISELYWHGGRVGWDQYRYHWFVGSSSGIRKEECAKHFIYFQKYDLYVRTYIDRLGSCVAADEEKRDGLRYNSFNNTMKVCDVEPGGTVWKYAKD